MVKSKIPVHLSPETLQDLLAKEDIPLIFREIKLNHSHILSDVIVMGFFNQMLSLLFYQLIPWH